MGTGTRDSCASPHGGRPSSPAPGSVPAEDRAALFPGCGSAALPPHGAGDGNGVQLVPSHH